ncbi:MAG: hypothetical protein HOE19_00735 [Candidatus Komeilibacteria bacterium]|nr:hypothetical protein [Candidatus Komeilibacteria bacterium]MBT4447344.1 hypothetical protein [Candidatus Komeilibacteria bacterium]
MKGQKLIYALIGLQLIAWGWHQWQGGQLSAQHYYIFCVGMLCGQLGAGIECWHKKSWGTFVVQCYFFVWTAIGGIQRYLQT